MDHFSVRTAIALLAIAMLAFPVTTTAAESPTASDPIAASDHTCALTQTGGVACWGDNSAGGLGDGTTTASNTPVDVVGLSSGVVAVATGDRYSCALTGGGGVKCWGYNEFGQLGDGTTTDRTTPIDATDLASGVVAIAARGEHTCALSHDGMRCWGANANGQLGDGTTTDSAVPVVVDGLPSGLVSIATGGEHTCVLTESGGVKCWGWNATGQVGDGATDDRTTPADVIGLTSSVTAIATGGRHTCALMTAGGVKCWGYGQFGQVGDGGTTDRSQPVDILGVAGTVTAITAGGNLSCALTDDGRVACWGIDLTGQVDDGTAVEVPDLPTGIRAIVAGFYHVCGATTTGGVTCWGGNDTGQLGDGSLTDSLVPVIVKAADDQPFVTTAGASESFDPLPISIAAVVGAALIVTTGSYLIMRRRRR